MFGSNANINSWFRTGLFQRFDTMRNSFIFLVLQRARLGFRFFRSASEEAVLEALLLTVVKAQHEFQNNNVNKDSS